MKTSSIDENYDRIKGDLVDRGLTLDLLIDDILDHVCCLVEDFMDQGDDFNASYHRALSSIGENRLMEIQHETILNLDNKFQRMKNFTYVFGLSAAILTIIGSGFKTLHWPGAGILITVGIVMIAGVFLPLFFINSYREQPEKKNPLYAIVGYITLALLLFGSLFKVMHWPGANVAIMSGAGFLIIGFVPLYVVNAFQRSGKRKVNLPYIIMLLVGVALVLLYSNIRMSRDLIDVYVEESVTSEAHIASIKDRTAQFLELTGDSTYADLRPTVVRIHDQARALQVMIRVMQEGMMVHVDEPGVSITEVNAKDNRGAGREAILDSGNGREFSLEARKFREMLFEEVKDPVVKSQIEDHLEFTGNVWLHEYGILDVANDPLVKNYYKLSDASKAIALSEFVAIAYLLHQ